MKQITNSLCLLLLSLWLIGCSRSETASAIEATDTTLTARNREAPQAASYDPLMDPLRVGAEFSKKLGDTLNIKMYEVTLNPGDSAMLHTHPDHTFYVLQ